MRCSLQSAAEALALPGNSMFLSCLRRKQWLAALHWIRAHWQSVTTLGMGVSMVLQNVSHIGDIMEHMHPRIVWKPVC